MQKAGWNSVSAPHCHFSGTP